MMAVQMAPSPPALNVILWKDVFVVIDNGKARASDYATLGQLVREQAARYPIGVGCLTIIPASATPPNDEVRRAMNEALGSLKDSLRCICWLVEGAGFQGAMVRAVLTGLRVFGRHPYPTHISNQIEDALSWIMTHLEGGSSRLAATPLAVATIRQQRAGSRFVRSF